MKANELRIGNYLHAIINQEIDRGNGIIEDVEVCEVVKVMGFDPFQNMIWCDSELYIENYNLQPIPLTGEWLERFGFEKASGDYVRYDLKATEDVYILYADDYSCGLFNSKESEENELGVIPNWETIKHVHQLQNLYFALTGEELQADETDQKVNL